ncbi:hypothetical protein [Nostoc sp. T09]|uniref:hypothetical protein n=1 Tax=Nostoc sp. T09 TaxID=1932621 RepID=UPI00118106FA|nr:hypothetical protein [Nostoc sp. T09]
MADRLEKIVVAMYLNKRSQCIVKQNLTVTWDLILLLLISDFLSNINLAIGIIGHKGSLILVTLGGLRLLN